MRRGYYRYARKTFSTNMEKGRPKNSNDDLLVFKLILFVIILMILKW